MGKGCAAIKIYFLSWRKANNAATRENLRQTRALYSLEIHRIQVL